MKLFDHAAASEKGEISLEQLSSKAGSDPLLTRKHFQVTDNIQYLQVNQRTYYENHHWVGFLQRDRG